MGSVKWRAAGLDGGVPGKCMSGIMGALQVRADAFRAVWEVC